MPGATTAFVSKRDANGWLIEEPVGPVISGSHDGAKGALMRELRQVAPEGQLPWAHRLQPATVVDRTGKLVELARGLRVVHVGFADTGCELTHRSQDQWLHSTLAASAREIVGLDISPEAVEAARSEGFEAYCVDCTGPEEVAKLDLEPFDLVVAGEILEHLEAPGPFLHAMRQLSGPDGQLVLTTPNALRPQNVLLALGRREWVHPDHVLTFTPRTLTVLLERSGWRIDEFCTYLQPAGPRSGFVSAGVTAARVLTRAQRLAVRYMSPYVADGFVVVATPSVDGNPATR